MTHAVVHFEIPADDPEKLASFYRDLFDWQVVRTGVGDLEYWMLQTVPTDQQGMPTEPGGINGGLLRRQAPQQQPINYVQIESVDDYLRKAKALGASVIVERMPILGRGWFAQLIDPQGNPFGIFQVDSAAR